MASFIILLHFLSFFAPIFLFAVQPAAGKNADYTTCSTPYSCGTIQNIGYPFWGENRPKFCGMPSFKLNCDNNNRTTFNVLQNFSFGFSVQAINTSSHTMEFLAGNLTETCYTLPQLSNVSLLNAFTPDHSYNWIRLFYGCNNTCLLKHHYIKHYNCYYFGDLTRGSGTAYYFGDNNSDISTISKSCLCKTNISFLADDRGKNKLKNKNGTLLSILGKEPIKINYMSNFTVCSNCAKSGGKCGSSESPPNNFRCYCPDGAQPLVCKEKKISLLILGLGIGGAILVFVAIMGFTAICLRKRLESTTRKASLDSVASEIEKGSIYFSVPLFSYNQLVEATANFDQSNVLGRGGFGTVYHGKLKDGREVAVKRLYEKSCKRVKQFMNEVELLTRLRHENLVSLYGCTSEHCKELLLVYEFVKNGTLADHLHGEKATSGSLPWPVRLRIAIETATALSYLHASDIIHRDVKSNNILLDSNFCVKVADFGLSRLFPTDVTHVSTAPQGTPGYLDPEYHQCYQLTDKSDVYSFGVVLIQLVSSLPAIDLHRHKHEINLSNYAVNKIQRCAFDELVDPQLGFMSDFKVRRMTRMVSELAFQCLQHDKELRPSMNEVLDVLKRIESADYQALLTAESMDNIVESEVVNVLTSNPPPLHVADDHAKLLSDHQLLSSSPMSVVEKWFSKSTSLSL